MAVTGVEPGRPWGLSSEAQQRVLYGEGTTQHRSVERGRARGGSSARRELAWLLEKTRLAAGDRDRATLSWGSGRTAPLAA